MSFGFGVGDFIAVLDKAKLYRERFADAPDHFDSLSREIASLASILGYIGRVEDQLTEDEQEALAAPIKESTKLLGELENIYNDNTSLETHEGTSRLSKLKPRVVWRRLRMKPEDVQKLRQRITMNVHFLSAIKGFRDSEAIHTTKQVVTSMHDEQTSHQEREILDWLTTTDYAPQQRDHLSRRYAGTNQWLLDSDEYKSWVSGQNRTIICPGMPGAGKTIMASVIIDDLLHRYRDDCDVGIAYVYCNFKDQERQNHYELLSSITKQLAQCRSPVPGSLKELYETHQRRKTSRTLQETTDMLQTVASFYDRVFIIIDALDECESTSRPAVLSEVFRLQTRHPTNILATSREIPEIIESAHFKNATILRILASDYDVSRYIMSCIPRMRNFVQARPDIQREIHDVVLCNVKGMFLLAELLITSLSYKKNVKDVRKALTVVGTDDDKYASVYEDALERIHSQPPDDAQLAYQVLSWLVFAKRPLGISEFQHALAVEESESGIDKDNITSANIIISVCAGLVIVEQCGTIRLFHQTTQEFLDKRRDELFPDGNDEIAETCAQYLCLEKVQLVAKTTFLDIPIWQRQGNWMFSSIQNLRRSRIPFYEYAACHWGLHARESLNFPSNIARFLRSPEMVHMTARIHSQLIGEDVPTVGAHLAGWFGLTEVFKNRLLSADNVHFADNKGQSTLFWAARQGHLDLVEYILRVCAEQLKNWRSNGEPSHFGRDSLYQESIRSFQHTLYDTILENRSDFSLRLLQFGADENVDLEQDGRPSLLILCVEKRDIEMLKLLLGQPRPCPNDTRDSAVSGGGVKLDKKFGYDTPLGFAASKGLDEMVKVLLEHGADIDADNGSALVRAAQFRNTSTIELLLNNGAKIRHQSESKAWSPHLILDTNNESVLKLVLDQGADVESTRAAGRTMLSVAAENRRLSILDIVLDHGANIEARDKEGLTPLWYAVYGNNLPTLKKLLEKGAELAIKDRRGRTPLFVAAEHGQLSILDMLLKYGANIEIRDNEGRTPLWSAVDSNNLPTLERLLEKGADFDAENQTCQTPLFFAASKDRTLMLAMLLKKGADIESRDCDGRTPLILVSGKGYTMTLAKLLEHGANIEAQDLCGLTSLSHAIRSSRGSAVDMLIAEGAMIEHKDCGGRSCLSLAAISGNLSAVKTLLRHGSTIDERDNEQLTPLWHAAQQANYQVVETLAEHGADLDCRDALQRAPIWFASTRDAHSVVKFLVGHGADVNC